MGRMSDCVDQIKPELRLTRAVLRPWRMEDAAALSRHGDNPRIAATMSDGFPAPFTEDAARRWLNRAMADGRNELRAIEVEGEAAGGIGIIFQEDVYRCCALVAYWLSEQHWGRGITTEAVVAMTREALGRRGVVRIQAGVFASNPASMRVLEKAGFQREAIHRQAIIKRGVVCDEHLYCLLAPGSNPGDAR